MTPKRAVSDGTSSPIEQEELQTSFHPSDERQRAWRECDAHTMVTATCLMQGLCVLAALVRT